MPSDKSTMTPEQFRKQANKICSGRTDEPREVDRRFGERRTRDERRKGGDRRCLK